MKFENYDIIFYSLSDVCKLICALLGTNNKAINIKLRELGTLNILLVSMDSLIFGNENQSTVENANSKEASWKVPCILQPYIWLNTFSTVQR